MTETDRGLKLLLGTVWHHRLTEPQNKFEYRVLYVETDLMNQDPQESSPWVFSYNRPNLYALNDRDHYHDGDEGYRYAIPKLIRDAAGDTTIAKVRMITQPSVLGYTFNPVSFFIGESTEGVATVVVAEVHNRIGQRHLYVMKPEISPEGAKPIDFLKQFYVSPFLDMEGTYRFSMTGDDCQIRLQFNLMQAKTEVLKTTLNLHYFDVSTWALLKGFMTHNMLPQKTILAIYWQALKLKMKGYRYRRAPNREKR